jgi:hypothetical protein
MYSTRILFTRKDKGSAHDDGITIKPLPDSTDIFEVVYRSPELKMDRKFLASFSGVLSYIEDTLTSMRYDTEPFEQIQLLTVIHPSVMYHVADMDDDEVRNLMLNMVRDSLRYSVTAVPR